MLCWIVPDTSLLIAGSLFPSGAGGFVLDSWRNGEVGFVLSMPILDELEGVLRRNQIPEHEIYYIRNSLAFHSKIVEPQRKISIIKDDPDNRILEAAVEGKADFIVSNDRHLLDLKEFEGIKIITRESMAEWIRKKSKNQPLY